MPSKPNLPEVEIREVAIGSLNPAPYNPRVDLQPEDPEYKALARAIGTWDLVEPLVWNEGTGNLVGGHQRLKVLKDMGLEEVEVSVVHLDLNSEMALNMALNNVEGAWDLFKLTELLADLDADGFDITKTGFSLGELEALVQEWDMPGGGPPDPDAYDAAEDLFLVKVERIRGEHIDAIHTAATAKFLASGINYEMEIRGGEEEKQE